VSKPVISSGSEGENKQLFDADLDQEDEVMFEEVSQKTQEHMFPQINRAALL
jgi:hypothetical protein